MNISALVKCFNRVVLILTQVKRCLGGWVCASD